MSHDKISAAARRRMAKTGEPYAAARRAVIIEHQATGEQSPDPQWFPISYAGNKVSALLDHYLFGQGPGRSGVEVGPDTILVRGLTNLRLDIPRASVRSVARSRFRTGGTVGVHQMGHGRWLVNGSADGLVELVIDPPLPISRSLATGFTKGRVTSLILSLTDPDGFIAASRPSRSAGANAPGGS